MLWEIEITEILGYLASIVIAISMLMNSLLRLRWINLIGASLFSIYGFVIGALPVGFLNFFIVCIDVYYLSKMYSKKEYFKILFIRPENYYLHEFLKFNSKDIKKSFPDFDYKPELNTVSFFVLRNMAVAGIFLAHKNGENSLHIGLDYVIPEYRDFKIGKFVFFDNREKFIENGFTEITTLANTKMHANYLQKMGFVQTDDSDNNLFIKQL